MFMITKNGYDKLIEDLKYLLEVERPRALELLECSRVYGEPDMLENTEYVFACSEQDKVENKIASLQVLLNEANVVEIKSHYDKVEFGATITLLDCDTEKKTTYQIVSSVESNPSQGLISIEAPIIREFLGSEVGEIAYFGDKEYELIAIK